jgi:hypothetical protein
MPEARRPEEWDGARYEREKRQFIERRALLRPIALHMAGIFAFTGLAGWACSWLLLQTGASNMPLRYAVAFLAAYLAFALAVRIWANSMHNERGKSSSTSTSDWLDGTLSLGNEPEGCLFAVAVFLVALLVAAVFTLFGGVPLLLEVAFEVVFAGVVVRRLGRRDHIGDWSGQLVRNTWLPALVAGAVLVSAAAWLQHQVPGARTLPEAWRGLHAQKR